MPSLEVNQTIQDYLRESEAQALRRVKPNQVHFSVASAFHLGCS